MRAMWLGFACAIVIAVIAGFGMEQFGNSSADLFQSESTRL